MATQRQVTAVWEAANARGANIGRETAEHIADALLAVSPAEGLSRADALELAVKTTDHLAEVPMKPNGYAVDGWRAPDLAARTNAITDLMAALLGEGTADR